MKQFFIRHGEKVFLAIVAVGAGYLLVTSGMSLATTTTLDAADNRNIRGIIEYRPDVPPREVADYRGRLASTFAGHGIYEGTAARGPIEAHYWREVLVEGEEDIIRDRPKRTVAGKLFGPTGLSASSSRGRVSLTWKQAGGEHVRAKTYYVFKKEGDGDWGATPFREVPAEGAKTLSLDDTDVKPETEYSYRIRTAGVAAPPDDKHEVKPDPSSIEVADGEWRARAIAGPVSATTPSDIGFSCSGVYPDRMQVKRARITVLRWNGERGDWDKYDTGTGVAVGEEVVGNEPPPPITVGGWEPKRIKTGYIVKRIVEDEKIWKWVEVVVIDPETGERRIERKKVFGGFRDYVVLYHQGKGREVTVVVGAQESGGVGGAEGGAAAPAPAARPKAKPEPKAGGSLLDQMRAKRKKSAEARGGGPAARPAARPGPGEAPPGAAPGAAPEGEGDALAGWTRFKSADAAVRFYVPGGWGQTEAFREDFGLSDPAAREIAADRVVVYKSGTPPSVVVASEKQLADDEVKILSGGRDLSSMDAALVSEYVCEGVRKRTVDSLKGQMGIPLGDMRIVETNAGSKLHAYGVSLREKTGRMVVVRYCTFAGGRLHALTFLCKADDRDAQEGVFEKIAKTLEW